MKTLKQIHEGFYKNTGSGIESMKSTIIEKYYLGTYRGPISQEDLLVIDGGFVVDMNKNTTVEIKTNESTVPVKFINSTGKSEFDRHISISDSPNITDLSFLPEGRYCLGIEDCGGNKGIDLSTFKGFKKLSTLEIKNCIISNIKGVIHTAHGPKNEFEFDTNDYNHISKTNFKNLPKNIEILKLDICNNYSVADIKGVPKHVTVTTETWPALLGDIDFGFKKLLFDMRWSKEADIPANLEEWLMKTDFKGTVVDFDSVGYIAAKGFYAKMRRIKKRVVKKRPELQSLILFQGEE